MLSPSSHSNNFLQAKSYPPCRRAGKLKAAFTLIEMLVVISIFMIITGVILANFPAFRDKAALDLLAQEIATTIRQAQVYGIGTREAGSGSDFTSYGIYFDLTDTVNLGEKAFYLYADRRPDLNTPPDQKFTNSTIDKVIEKFAITGAAKISQLLGCSGTPCTYPPPVNATNLSTLDIFFQRFYPEATFTGDAGGSSYVKIVIQSTRDVARQKEIQVWTTGQIVVDDHNPNL